MKQLWVEDSSTHKYFKGVCYVRWRLEQKNKAKLNAAKEAGYKVILVLNKEYINA